MSLSVTFHRAAHEEFIEAAAWYEAQHANLGIEFIDEIERCVVLAAEQPQIYAVVYKGVRHVTARRFPYSVYFRAEAVRLVVLSVFHGSRDPAAWKRRAQ